MAAKHKLMKFLEEAREHAEFTNRRPTPRSPLLYLMQLRAPGHEVIIPKRRLVIPVDVTGNAELETPVKISFPQPDNNGGLNGKTV
jgi:hypothetical protein